MTTDHATSTLQQHFLRQLRNDWLRFNDDLLSGQLKPPIFVIDDAIQRLGQWHPASRTIGLSWDHLRTAPWLEVELTLKHEMAHQVVSELFGAQGGAPHGRLFRKAAGMLKIADSPRAKSASDPAGNRVLRRVRKLMSLAAATTANEAQSAMAAASRLLLKHNLSLSEVESTPGFTYRWVGHPTGRVTLERKLIARILQDHFFVQCLWVGTVVHPTEKRVRILEIMGQRHNLALAEYVHEYLTATLDRLWKQYQKHTKSRSRTDRNQYRIGVVMGFMEHLESQKMVHQEAGLIWMGDPALSDYLSSRYPRTGSMSRSYYRTGKAHQAGKKDGRKLRIRPGLRTDHAANRGRLLAR